MQEVVVDLSRNEDAYHTLNVFDETGRVLPSVSGLTLRASVNSFPWIRMAMGWMPHYDAEGHWCCSGRAHWLCEDLVAYRPVRGRSKMFPSGPSLYETGLSDK